MLGRGEAASLLPAAMERTHSTNARYSNGYLLMTGHDTDIFITDTARLFQFLKRFILMNAPFRVIKVFVKYDYCARDNSVRQF